METQQPIITETSSLKKVTANAVVNGMSYAITYEKLGDQIKEVQIGVSKVIPTDGAIASGATYGGSVGYKDGFCNQTLGLQLTAAERLQITADTNAIYEQIIAAV